MENKGLSFGGGDANEGETGFEETLGGIKRLEKEKSGSATTKREKKMGVGGHCQHTHTHRKDLHLIWEGPGTNELPHRLLPSPSTPPACCVIQWDDVREAKGPRLTGSTV